jgi:putative transposase
MDEAEKIPRVDRISSGPIDFASDALAQGRRIWLLNVFDVCTREAVVIEIDTSLPGSRVVQMQERVADERGVPQQLV